MPKRKKGNPPLWSVPRITDPRYPGWTVRITELRAAGTLYACYRRDGRQRMSSLKLTRKDLGNTAKAQKEKACAIGRGRDPFGGRRGEGCVSHSRRPPLPQPIQWRRGGSVRLSFLKLRPLRGAVGVARDATRARKMLGARKSPVRWVGF